VSIKISTPEQLNDIKGLNFPIVIPVFNSPTYLNNTRKFFEERGFNEFLILDMGSTHTGMEDVLNSFSDESVILTLADNPGPRAFYFDRRIYDWLPQFFIATDPDMGFNEKLTHDDFLKLIEISERLNLFKIGSALNIDIKSDNVLDKPFNYNGRMITIREVESGYYNDILSATEDMDLIYIAAIDTTFALYNKRLDNGNFMAANCRIAGKYTADHYGWFDPPPIPAEEYEFYRESVKGNQYASTETLKRGENYAY